MSDTSLRAKQNFTTHGLTTRSDTRKCYEAWLDIKRKCYDDTAREYSRYGANGRTISEEWINNPTSFVEYVIGLPNFEMSRSLDRIENKDGYTRGNLRWATAKEQARNRGMSVRNTSGVQGVAFRKVGKATFATAVWFDLEDGKSRSKTFAVSKFGLLPAFKLAYEYRHKMLEELNKQGAGYSQNHGKDLYGTVSSRKSEFTDSEWYISNKSN